MQPKIRIGLTVICVTLAAVPAAAQVKDDIIAQAPGSFSLDGRVYHKHLRDAIPPATDYVTDWENLYTDAQEAHLDSMLQAFENKTTIQIAVVTIDTAMASRDEFDSITLRIANSWGVGQKEKNNGIVIGISNGLGIMRIQNGEGITQLNDEATQKIVDKDFLPFFEKGEYYAGTLRGIKALMHKLAPDSSY